MDCRKATSESIVQEAAQLAAAAWLADFASRRWPGSASMNSAPWCAATRADDSITKAIRLITPVDLIIVG